MSILASVSSNYKNEIGGLRTEIEELKIEILELSKNTVPTVAPTTTIPVTVPSSSIVATTILTTTLETTPPSVKP